MYNLTTINNAIRARAILINMLGICSENDKFVVLDVCRKIVWDCFSRNIDRQLGIVFQQKVYQKLYFGEK